MENEKETVASICESYGFDPKKCLPGKYDEAFMGMSNNDTPIYSIERLHELGYNSEFDGDFPEVIFAEKCDPEHLQEGTIILSPNEEILNQAIVANVNGMNIVIYDYNTLVEKFMEANEWSEEEAIDWISYNTLRSLPYMGSMAPIIMQTLEYMF